MSIITFTITYTYIMMETWTFRYYFSKSFCLIHYFMSDVYDLGHWFQKLEKKITWGIFEYKMQLWIV